MQMEDVSYSNFGDIFFSVSNRRSSTNRNQVFGENFNQELFSNTHIERSYTCK